MGPTSNSRTRSALSTPSQAGIPVYLWVVTAGFLAALVLASGCSKTPSAESETPAPAPQARRSVPSRILSEAKGHWIGDCQPGSDDTNPQASRYSVVLWTDSAEVAWTLYKEAGCDSTVAEVQRAVFWLEGGAQSGLTLAETSILLMTRWELKNFLSSTASCSDLFDTGIAVRGSPLDSSVCPELLTSPRLGRVTQSFSIQRIQTEPLDQVCLTVSVPADLPPSLNETPTLLVVPSLICLNRHD
jgi:hypothetical protein